MTVIKNMHEEEIIELFSGLDAGHGVHLGFGDDCALLEKDPEHFYAVTTDIVAEDVHYTQNAIPAHDLGYKSLAVNISDVAGMGAVPRGALLSISLSSSIEKQWLEKFRDGLHECARRYQCPLIGGDTTSSKGKSFICITVIGEVERERVLLRSTARSGDDIWCGGVPGLSHLGFLILQGRDDIPVHDPELCKRTHIHPEPQVSLGRVLASKELSTAAMDCSDGLLRDLGRLAAASGIGAIIESSLLPREHFSSDPGELFYESALHGGEDYYLLFTSDPEKRSQLEEIGGIIRIGNMRSESGLALRDEAGGVQNVKASGFEHFS